jgi:hypothetical protein
VRAEGSGWVVEVGGGCEVQASSLTRTFAASLLGVKAQTTITARRGAFGSVGTGHWTVLESLTAAPRAALLIAASRHALARQPLPATVVVLGFTWC